MIYRRVGNRCAVSLAELKLPVAAETALLVLRSLSDLQLVQSGFNEESFAAVRQLVGVSKYRRRALQHEAPAVFDCSGLTQWFYGQLGVELPRRALQQSEVCDSLTSTDALRAGDLLFSRSQGHNYFRHNETTGIGHVALMVTSNTIVHAVPELGVVEQSLADLQGEIRGARRVIHDPSDFLVFELASDSEIISSDDFFFLILDKLNT